MDGKQIARELTRPFVLVGVLSAVLIGIGIAVYKPENTYLSSELLESNVDSKIMWREDWGAREWEDGDPDADPRLPNIPLSFCYSPHLRAELCRLGL